MLQQLHAAEAHTPGLARFAALEAGWALQAADLMLGEAGVAESLPAGAAPAALAATCIR